MSGDRSGGVYSRFVVGDQDDLHAGVQPLELADLVPGLPLAAAAGVVVRPRLRAYPWKA